MTTAGDERAWGWVEHLRAGGTTPWAQWAGPGPAGPHGRVVPGAQQLELVRRLNAAGRPSTTLVDRVLAASAVGRGQPDLELVGAVPQRRFGARPIDPADLPASELVRVATSLLAEDVVSLGVRRPREGFPRPWRVRYRLGGDPLIARDVRTHLTRHGRAPGGPQPRVVVLGGPVDHLVAHTWASRCFEQGAERWPDFVRGWHQRRMLPPRVDLAGVAETLAARHGRDAVHVVVDQAALPGLVGVRRLPRWEPPGADTVELGRRLAGVLGMLVPPTRRHELMTWTLWPRIPRTTTPPVSLPAEHLDWAADMARRTARRLRRGGYAVHGDLAGLEPAGGAGPGPGLLAGRVLDLALRMLLDDGWAEVPR